MKALIRNEDEIVKESDGIVGIDWATGYPLTAPEWEGGRPYKLVENYIEYSNGETTFEDPEVPLEIVEEPKVEEPVEDVVIINGKTYTKDELRSILEN